MFDVVLLSRIQFAFTVMFHYIFPPLSIGLGLLLVIMEGTYLWTKNPVYERMTKFWVKIFALNFSIGVASGIVMEFQFGTNWATYSRFVGDVFGSALAAEGIFAFFLESGFLAILVFGWDRVTPIVHFFSTCMVSLGSMFSAVWIIVANSWQQTPVGYHIVDKDGNSLPEPFIWNPLMDGIKPRAEITDFWAMVFNPSSMDRLAHSIIGAFILSGFVVMSVSAWYLLKGRHIDFAKRCFTIGLIFAGIFSIAQLFSGHRSALIAAEHQPAKLAAFEGVYKTEESTPIYLFGIPNSKEGRVDFGIPIPGVLSFMVHGDFKKPVIGLDQFKPEDRPPVALPFFMFHLMVGLGTFFIGITLLGMFFLWRGTIWSQKWLLWIFVLSAPLPYIANQAGWIAAEVGRQPWIVYNLLRTADGVSKAVAASNVLISLILFMFVYALLFVLWLYLLDRKIKHGPDDDDTPDGSHQADAILDVIGDRAPGGKSLSTEPKEAF